MPAQARGVCHSRWGSRCQCRAATGASPGARAPPVPPALPGPHLLRPPATAPGMSYKSNFITFLGVTALVLDTGNVQEDLKDDFLCGYMYWK